MTVRPGGPAGGDVVEMARALIRIPSPNPGGDERAVAGALTELAADAGLPAPTVLERSSTRPNLLFTLDFGPGGRHLVLCGHMDTKPIGDAAWSVDPLGAEISGDRLYGLGSADMKGALAAMVLAARNLARGGALRSGRLSLLFTADEEDGAHHGAQYLAGRAGTSAPTPSSSASPAVWRTTTTRSTSAAAASPGSGPSRTGGRATPACPARRASGTPGWTRRTRRWHWPGCPSRPRRTRTASRGGRRP